MRERAFRNGVYWLGVWAVFTGLSCEVMAVPSEGTPSVKGEMVTPNLSSDLTFTNWIAMASPPQLGADLKERAHLLFSAFQPGVDDLLDAEGASRFAQIYPEAPRSLTINYQSNDRVWNIDPQTPTKEARRTGNLAFLDIAIHHADNMLCALNDPETGRVVASSGEREPVWPPSDRNDPKEGPITRVAHLGTGVIGCKMMYLANFILEHPEIHGLAAPAPIDIARFPSHIDTVGSTYLDRALLYVNTLQTICDFFIEEGSYWAFDRTDPDRMLGWWFNNSVGQYKNGELVEDVSDLDRLANMRKKYPDGITFSPQVFEELDVSPRPVNRVLALNSLLAGLAHGLNLIDHLEGATTHQSTILAYNCIVRNCNHTIKSLSFDIEEGELWGTSRIFQYVPNRVVDFKVNKEAWYIEDATHLAMDFASLSYQMEISDLYPKGSSFEYMTEEDLIPLMFTAFSRFFDHKANIVCPKIYSSPSETKGERTRHLGLDAEGRPNAHGDYQVNTHCPMFSDWVGRYGKTLQHLAYNAKILEMGDEWLRLLGENEKLAKFVYDRPDTWPEYRFVFPFQLKLLRETRSRYMKQSSARKNKYAPVCRFPNSIKIRGRNTPGDPLVKLKGQDRDRGQRVTYWIIGGNQGFHLEIDPFSGIVSLNKYYPIQHTNMVTWKLMVMVCDDGYPVRYVIKEIPVSFVP